MEIKDFRISRLDKYNFVVERYITTTYNDPKSNGEEKTVSGWRRIGGYFNTAERAVLFVKEYIFNEIIDQNKNYDDVVIAINEILKQKNEIELFTKEVSSDV